MKPIREHGSASHSLRLQRLGVVMEPAPGNAMEVEGVLNPASARGRDGHLYLFPRLVARGNYSRIGIARVRFNEAGDPVGVERLGIVLEPQAAYELRPDGGGCEDPRITFIEPLQRYVMTYTALSSLGPRIALAMSEDLFHWERMGLAIFMPFDGVDFNEVANKDALLFPVAISDPHGQPAMALIHRPLFPGTGPDEKLHCRFPRVLDILRESIWISYHSLVNETCDKHHHLCHFDSHRRLATPVAAWEQLKIGGGTPPILTPSGWLFLYHGVCEALHKHDSAAKLRYSAGLLVLDEKQPHRIRYRSPEPVLTPDLPKEREGIVPNVVFPTAIDRRDDLGLPGRFDVYYGMADKRIGVARLDLPAHLLAEVTPQASPGTPGQLYDEPLVPRVGPTATCYGRPLHLCTRGRS
jgi:beta-1,2-mannobiose phosphorylase / 1,2-beta-oligomannan phosphorylase